MPTRKSPRRGSLQFWPRKRAAKFLPRVNWKTIDSDSHLKGFICYKAGMVSLAVRDNTPDSLSKGRRIVIPSTIIECPPMKIYSARFYKEGNVAKDIILESTEKDLRKKLKVPKKVKEKLDNVKADEYDDVSVLVYSLVKNTGLKKTSDLSEIGLKGSIEDKIQFIKDNIGKELSVSDVFKGGDLVDLRGLTKGKGLQGPVKRFGIQLKQHKAEKGRRRPGSLGPWHPARVTFRAPQAGQMGMFTRIVYNNKIVGVAKASEKPIKGLKNYGDIKTEYLIVRGSVQGPSKRVLLATHSFRETKKQKKKDFELVEVLR